MKMNFERGIDPKQSLDIGLNHKGRIPEEGRSFLVQFLLKKSCPEFYPLQEKQRRGEPIVAICIGHLRLIYDPFTFHPHKFIKCRIGEEEFISSMNDKGDWEISNEF